MQVAAGLESAPERDTLHRYPLRSRNTRHPGERPEGRAALVRLQRVQPAQVR